MELQRFLKRLDLVQVHFYSINDDWMSCCISGFGKNRKIRSAISTSSQLPQMSRNSIQKSFKTWGFIKFLRKTLFKSRSRWKRRSRLVVSHRSRSPCGEKWNLPGLLSERVLWVLYKRLLLFPEIDGSSLSAALMAGTSCEFNVCRVEWEGSKVARWQT